MVNYSGKSSSDSTITPCGELWFIYTRSYMQAIIHRSLSCCPVLLDNIRKNLYWSEDFLCVI